MLDIRDCIVAEVMPAHWSSGGQRTMKVIDPCGDYVTLRVPKGMRVKTGDAVSVRVEPVSELVVLTTLGGAVLPSVFYDSPAYFVVGKA